MEFVTFQRYARISEQAPAVASRFGPGPLDLGAVRTYLNDRVGMFGVVPVTDDELSYLQAAVALFRCHCSGVERTNPGLYVCATEAA